MPLTSPSTYNIVDGTNDTVDNENVRSSLNCSISEPLSAMEILKNLKLKNVNRLVVGQLNINSISGKFDLLKEVIKDNIDILVITET